MKIRTALVALTLLTGVSTVFGPALAQPAASAESLVGKSVISAEGKTLGVIERAITNAGGQVRQVLVRTRKGSATILRTLPYASLTEGPKGLTSVLSEAEYTAIPASQTE